MAKLTQKSQYKVVVTFHGAEDVSSIYITDGPTKSDARRNAIDRAAADLIAFDVISVGNGVFQILVNFHKFKRGSIRLFVSARDEVAAGQLAVVKAKKYFSTQVIPIAEEDV